MQKALETLLNNIAEIFKVKSLVTLLLTGVLIAMLVGAFNPAQEFVTLYCTAYGSIITYFFTRKEKEAAEAAEAAKLTQVETTKVEPVQAWEPYVTYDAVYSAGESNAKTDTRI